MRDLFSQYTYVSVTLRNVNLRSRARRKQQSQGTVEAKRARREQEKVQKKKARCGESSQARFKLCSLFMFDSTVVVLELHGLPTCAMRTYALAQRGVKHHPHA